MTNREILLKIKEFDPLYKHIENIAEKIISNTCNNHIEGVNYIVVTEPDVLVGYDYTCRGEWIRSEIEIPIEWFDEGFDYVKAYEKILRRAEANRKRAEKARLKHAAEKRKKAKELKKKKEYNMYLELKKKYESDGENK